MFELHPKWLSFSQLTTVKKDTILGAAQTKLGLSYFVRALRSFVSYMQAKKWTMIHCWGCEAALVSFQTLKRQSRPPTAQWSSIHGLAGIAQRLGRCKNNHVQTLSLDLVLKVSFSASNWKLAWIKMHKCISIKTFVTVFTNSESTIFFSQIFSCFLLKKVENFLLRSKIMPKVFVFTKKTLCRSFKKIRYFCEKNRGFLDWE